MYLGERMRVKKEPETINTPDGVLARLKHKICIALNIDNTRLRMLIDRFVLKVFNGVENTRTHYDKINIYNELSKNRMTIKVFFKFLRILDLPKVRITVTVTTRRGDEITVFEEINNFANDYSTSEKSHDN